MKSEKLIVPVSGGKDSQLCLSIAIANFSRDDIICVHQNTGYDHHLTYEHLFWMEDFYGIKIEHTHSEKYKNIFDLIEKTVYFPSSVARSCTSNLNQKPFGNWLVKNALLSSKIWLGMRADEGVDRSRKYGSLLPTDVFSLPDLSSKYDKKFFDTKVSLPIVDLTKEAVFAELKRRGEKINPLYGMGASRVGCFPCLLGNNSDWKFAATDQEGIANIKKLIEIEDKFAKEKNPRKLIKIHKSRNVRGLLAGEEIIGGSECGWCSI